MNNIYGRCLPCSGTGKVNGIDDETPPNVVEEDCSICLGSGQVSKFVLHEDLIALLEDTNDKFSNPINLFYSYQVLEVLDATEHNGLTDAQKDGVLCILACGLIDLNDGKASRTRLWNWFGAESTTVANLTALLS
jgi:hypothetical protein